MGSSWSWQSGRSSLVLYWVCWCERFSRLSPCRFGWNIGVRSSAREVWQSLGAVVPRVSRLCVAARRWHLTPPSSGRAKGRCAPLAPPLMSNVRSLVRIQHPESPRLDRGVRALRRPCEARRAHRGHAVLMRSLECFAVPPAVARVRSHAVSPRYSKCLRCLSRKGQEQSGLVARLASGQQGRVSESASLPCRSGPPCAASASAFVCASEEAEACHRRRKAQRMVGHSARG